MTDSAAGTDADETAPLPEFAQAIRADIAELEDKTRRMLAYYKEQGPGTPLNAHFSAGGSGDRTAAYARNRTLRLDGLVEHVGRGKYDYRLQARLRDEGEDISDDDAAEYAAAIERSIIDESE